MAQFLLVVGVAFWIDAVITHSVYAAVAGGVLSTLAVFVLWIEAAYIAPGLLPRNQETEERKIV